MTMVWAECASSPLRHASFYLHVVGVSGGRGGASGGGRGGGATKGWEDTRVIALDDLMRFARMLGATSCHTFSF